MSKLGEIERGVLEALQPLVILSVATFVVLVAFDIPNPTADLLGGIASLGTGLLLAYVVEISWLAGRIRRVPDYETRLGAFVGLATAGLLGIVTSLLLAAHRAAEHSNLLDRIGLSWVVASLAILGGIVVVQPLLVHEWSNDDRVDSD